MKLEIGNIWIKDVQLGTETMISDGVLTINPAPLTAKILEDERIKKCQGGAG